jgi:hypothetical protein
VHFKFFVTGDERFSSRHACAWRAFNRQHYSISFVDIDGNKLSTADGHVTIVVLTTSADREQARIVGDHVPDFCLGNPAYRMITVFISPADTWQWAPDGDCVHSAPRA